MIYLGLFILLEFLAFKLFNYHNPQKEYLSFFADLTAIISIFTGIVFWCLFLENIC